MVRPRATFARLLNDPCRLSHGLAALLLIGVLYTLTVAGLAIAGARPTFPPFITIPPPVYYFWETFFCIPVFLTGWLVASAIVYLTARALRASGGFNETAALLGFAALL
ncbi:MAG: hypothetical protein AB1597_05130 [Chloroflexota bacterium]